MNTPTEFLQHLRRRWWWSEEPYWKYLDPSSRGWANLVDQHPGLFNLAWLMAAAPGVPTDFAPYAATTQWVYEKGMHTHCGTKNLADLAFTHNLHDFTVLLKKSKVRLPKLVPRGA